MVKSGYRWALALMGALWMGTMSAGAAELTFAGSTTVQKRIMEPTAAALTAATGVSVKVLGINSGKGLEALRDGKADASIASSPLPSLLKKVGLPDDGTYQEHVLEQDDVVPIVNVANPLKELSWEQLASINTGKVTNWKEVGGTDQKIVVVTSQPDAATRIFFQEKVMENAPYVADAREVKSTRQEVDMVAKLKGAIGAVSAAFVTMNAASEVKVLGTKDITRPLSIITKGAPTPEIQTVIDFLKSPEAKKLYN